MGKYTVSGVDTDSGMQTSLVVEAPSQEEAVRVAVTRGIRVLKADNPNIGERAASHADIAAVVVELQAIRLELANVQRAEAAYLTDRAARQRLRTTIAWGVFSGLLLWVMLPVLVGLLIVFLLQLAGYAVLSR